MPDDNLPEKVTTLWRVVFGDPDTGDEGDHKKLGRLYRAAQALVILAVGVAIGLGILNGAEILGSLAHLLGVP